MCLKKPKTWKTSVCRMMMMKYIFKNFFFFLISNMYSKEVLLCFSLDFYRSGRSSTQLCWDWSFRAEQSPSFQLNAADLAAAKVETSETTPLRRTTTSTYGPKHVALQWDRSRCGRHSRHSRHTYVRTLTHTTLLHKYTDHCALPRVESLGWKKLGLVFGAKSRDFFIEKCVCNEGGGVCIYFYLITERHVFNRTY